MQAAYFFGYGSLVNRQTHAFTPVHRATAKGWRRAWRVTPDRDIAFLTAVADPDGSIDGLIAPVPEGGWAVLDEREFAYERRPAAHQVKSEEAAPEEVAIYAIAPDRLREPDDDHPVLLSYLDVVVQGYLAEFGPAGATHFFETTDGWDVPILDDRADPRYPRAQTLGAEETAVVDEWLGRRGCRILR